jgi:hypothetical protein
MIQTLQISSSNFLLDSNSQMKWNRIYYLFIGKLAEYKGDTALTIKFEIAIRF